LLALGAAAKVTLVMGCEKPPMVTAETATATSAPDAIAPLPMPEAGPPMANGCGATDGVKATLATLQCCEESTQALVAAHKKPSTPEEVACCRALVAHNDEAMQDGGFQEMPSRSACCSALQWRGSMTCTPWGPPMPPEMIA
jgi:hypothetical protein